MRFNEDSPLTSPEAMSDGYSHRRHGSNNSTDEIGMSSYGEMQKEKDKKVNNVKLKTWSFAFSKQRKRPGYSLKNLYGED